jgi:hypothetical protein
MMSCPSCAAPVSGSDSFCGQCGAPLSAVTVDQRDSRHLAQAAGVRAYPTLPPYDPSAYPAPQPYDDESILPSASGPPHPYGAPDYASPAAVPAPAAAEEWYDPAPHVDPADEAPRTRWLAVVGVAILAVIAVTLAGLALLKHSRRIADRQPGSLSSVAGTSERQSTRQSTVRAPLRSVAVTGTPSGTAYQVSVWAEDRQTKCAAHAHGQAVITFLTNHPCTSMTRRLGTTIIGGKAVGFALTDINFASATTAAAFRALVTKDGTGNLDDLLIDGKRLPSGPRTLPAPDGFSSVNEAREVVVVDSWYLSGSTPENDPPLTLLAADFFGHDGIA